MQLPDEGQPVPAQQVPGSFRLAGEHGVELGGCIDALLRHMQKSPMPAGSTRRRRSMRSRIRCILGTQAKHPERASVVDAISESLQLRKKRPGRDAGAVGHAQHRAEERAAHAVEGCAPQLRLRLGW